MPPWLTVVLPVLTYIGGVLSKPLQTTVEDWRARRNLRNCLYADLGHNLDVAATRMKLMLNSPRERERDTILGARFTRDGFDYALKNPVLFHQLRESKRIRFFYESLNSLQVDVNTKSDGEVLGSLGFLIRNAAEGLKAGDYSRDLVYKHLMPTTKDLIELREKG
jgi:hypothetical protein